jgi:hypothetical protein
MPMGSSLGCGGSTRLTADSGPSSVIDAMNETGSSSGSGSSGGYDAGSGSSSGASSSGCTSFVDAGEPDANDWGQPVDGGAWSPICPNTQPASGTKCSPEAVGQYCEYGSAWWSSACDTVMYCGTQDKVWANYNPSSTGCLPEPGPNCATCPTSPSGLAGLCSSAGVTCHYGLGSNCSCSTPPGAESAAWNCFPPAGCPSTRPRIGAPCTSSPPLGCPYSCYEGVSCAAPGPTWQPLDNASCP